MEFDDLKKIWDVQNNEPIYVVNEAAMEKTIIARSKELSRLANINEIGLMIITTLTGGYLLIDAYLDGDEIYSYLAAIAFILIGGFVLFRRIQRKKMERSFDRSMLGELDLAIANAAYLANTAKTFVWWFLFPAGVTSLLNMVFSEAPFWKWIFVPGSFLLAFLVVRLDLKRAHLPRKQKLEVLRKKLTEEVNA
ncbi:MAG: hypothetical protein KDC34_11490 [Saprospiraceae bacterium]|nr:hypothetical protein [Saprospiraceae bacterium]